MKKKNQDSVTLKWGTLKAWHLETPACRKLMDRYIEIGASISAMMQHDTPEQKQIICDIIDKCNADAICLDWEGKDVSKEEAKQYVLDYGQNR